MTSSYRNARHGSIALSRAITGAGAAQAPRSTRCTLSPLWGAISMRSLRDSPKTEI